MSKSYGWRILGRAVEVFTSTFEGDRGYEKGWHGRVSVHIDEKYDRVISVEYHVPTHHYGASFRATYDSPISASLSCGIFGVYLRARHDLLGKVRDAVVRMWPLERTAYSFSGREFSINFHDHGVYWSIGADDMGWSSKTPKWRHGAWHPLGHNMRQGDTELVEEREVLVPMPERSYRATARLERGRWGFKRLPRYFDRVDYHVDLKMHPGEQIPHPGKGENSYDCGEDATFGMSARGPTIEDGVGHLVASVLRSRMKYGGPGWKPEAAMVPK